METTRQRKDWKTDRQIKGGETAITKKSLETASQEKFGKQP